MKKRIFWIAVLFVVCVLGAYAQNININSMNGMGSYTLNNWSTVVGTELLARTVVDRNWNRYRSFTPAQFNPNQIPTDLQNIVDYMIKNQLPPQSSLDIGDCFYTEIAVQNQQGNYNNGYVIFFIYNGNGNWPWAAWRFSM